VTQNEAPLVLSKHDLDTIASAAKVLYPSMSLPQKIGGKQVESSSYNVICIVEATIGFLNNKCAFRRFPKFDRR
jgi:hypothetical protein